MRTDERPVDDNPRQGAEKLRPAGWYKKLPTLAEGDAELIAQGGWLRR